MANSRPTRPPTPTGFDPFQPGLVTRPGGATAADSRSGPGPPYRPSRPLAVGLVARPGVRRRPPGVWTASPVPIESTPCNRDTSLGQGVVRRRPTGGVDGVSRTDRQVVAVPIASPRPRFQRSRGLGMDYFLSVGTPEPRRRRAGGTRTCAGRGRRCGRGRGPGPVPDEADDVAGDEAGDEAGDVAGDVASRLRSVQKTPRADGPLDYRCHGSF